MKAIRAMTGLLGQSLHNLPYLAGQPHWVHVSFPLVRISLPTLIQVGWAREILYLLHVRDARAAFVGEGIKEVESSLF